MAKIDIGIGFSQTLETIPLGEFSTADFISAYSKAHPIEWASLESKHGPGGRGAGQYQTVFSHVARRLSMLARDGQLTKLNYRVAPEWWGNPEVQYWSRGSGPDNAQVHQDTVDPEFREGSLALKVHLRRERAWGLAKSKKADYRSKHGKLTCEKCGLDPEERFGTAIGAAVIEVHHAAMAVGTMKPGHKTKLSDLQCLCANCHRLVHAEINQQIVTT